MSLSDSLFFDVGANLKSAERQFSGFFGRLKSMTEGMHAMTGSVAATGQILSTAFQGGADALSSVLSVGSDMEKFEGQLTTLMGSSSAARNRLDQLFTFASQTPFELDEVVKAEVTMQGFGAETERVLGGLIDFTAATGADLAQMSIDIGKAWTQGASGLESDFGRVLRAEIEMREGTNAAKMSLDEFREAMVSALDEGRFAGGAAKLSRTFGGMMSNLMDNFNGFKREINDAGLFNNIKASLQTTLKYMEENKEEAKALAGEISDGIWWGLKATVATVGAAATGFQAVRAGAMLVAAVVADITRGLIESADGARNLAVTLAELSGNDRLAEIWRKGDAAMDALAIKAAGFRDEMIKGATAILSGRSPAETLRDLMIEIEETAAGFAKETTEGTARSAEGMGALAEGTDKAAKALEAYHQKHRDLVADLGAMARTATAAQLDGVARVMADREEDLRDAAEKYQASVDLSKEALAKRLIDHEAFLLAVEEADAAYFSAWSSIVDAADAKAAEIRAKEEKDREEAAGRALDIVRGSAMQQLSVEEQLLQERSQVLRDYMTEAEAAALSEQQIQADRARIIMAYDEQIHQARQAQMMDTIGQVQAYAGQGIDMLSSALDTSSQFAADTATRLTDRLVAIGEYLTDSQKKQMVQQIMHSEGAARRQWEISSALKKGEIVAAGALGVANAFAQNPPPSPLGFIGAALIAASTIGSLIAVDNGAPKFHAGGPIDMAPDEVPIIARRGEFMVNSLGKDMAGEQQLRQLNAGVSANQERFIPVSTYRHDEQADTYFDDRFKRTPTITTALSATADGYRSSR